jgi:hypothetical protein
VNLLVSGTRRDCEDVWVELDSFVARHGRPDKLIVGGARGVDARARRWARARGIPVYELAVEDDDWADLGDAAGHARNEAMVALCGPDDFLVAFPRGHSSGTRGCVRLAKQVGMTCYVLDPVLPYVWTPIEGPTYLNQNVLGV